MRKRNLNLAVVSRSVLHHCTPVYHGVLPSSLEKAVTSQIYKKDNWQCASAELDKCTARVEGCQAGPRVLLHTLHHYALRPKIILVDFNYVSCKNNDSCNVMQE